MNEENTKTTKVLKKQIQTKRFQLKVETLNVLPSFRLVLF